MSLGVGASVYVISDHDKPPVGSGDASRQYDSWDGDNPASEDWVGYTFTTTHTFYRVVFQEGIHFWDGGWFNTLTVQVRQNGEWVNVSGLTSTPAYTGNNGVSFETFTLDFAPIQGDGIRLYGAPGGAAAFISVGELEAFWTDDGGGGGGGGGGQAGEALVTSQAQTVIAAVPVPLGTGAPLSAIRDGDKPPVGSGDGSAQYDSWDGDNPASEDWVGYTFGDPPDLHPRRVPGRHSLLGRRMVQHADGAGAAERAVGERVGPDDHAGVSREQRRELRDLHPGFHADPG